MTLPFDIVADSDIEKWRAETFWTKEGETIEWIKSFRQPKCFYDVGANVGLYSLYAAVVHLPITVAAFEPATQNYLRLMRNIRRNNLSLRIWGLHCGLSNETGITEFFIPDETFGASDGQINQPVNEHGDHFKARWRYPIAVYSMDHFATLFSRPDYVKIDVDGHDHQILCGMAGLLRRREVKGILFECNSRRDEVIGYMNMFGYVIDNRFDDVPNHSRKRRAKEGIGAENIIFKRKED